MSTFESDDWQVQGLLGHHFQELKKWEMSGILPQNRRACICALNKHKAGLVYHVKRWMGCFSLVVMCTFFSPLLLSIERIDLWAGELICVPVRTAEEVSRALGGE